MIERIHRFIENRKVFKLSQFSYKIAKTANFKNALTRLNTWIWRLKFWLRVQIELYSILFTKIFGFKRKWFYMCHAVSHTLLELRLSTTRFQWKVYLAVSWSFAKDFPLFAKTVPHQVVFGNFRIWFENNIVISEWRVAPDSTQGENFPSQVKC
jgi:hypothetical protein